MRLAPLFLGVGFLVSSGFATANEACDNANTQMELTQCTAQVYQEADGELNEAYQELISKLSQSSSDQLRAAQRAWIAFRDAECAYESSAVEGGSAQPMVRNGCLTALTKQRTERLREHASCEEGDMSCPH
ncbi:lysozyme inhibitor LprI family protein [Vreelandella nigrificans]|uniref:Lysozyme inhibitor LprI-like N-terminal domain-containing protein n=1 Tax=Vreelandella nigrificans TaxID=2042704 RepID=A0A2A4HR13_9GAMM|nr:lysozyme inhibitor LprI family protein [Halomonas nigrificans]PCF96543.1 hypothetical protein CPA45_05865 [Halomonas nigrificans]